MDKQQALELCVALWRKTPRSFLEKKEFCKKLTGRDMLNSCPACQYTLDIADPDYVADSENVDCNSCPIKGWNAKERGIRFACEEDDDSPYACWLELPHCMQNPEVDGKAEQAKGIIRLVEESLADEEWMSK